MAMGHMIFHHNAPLSKTEYYQLITVESITVE